MLQITPREKGSDGTLLSMCWLYLYIVRRECLGSSIFFVRQESFNAKHTNEKNIIIFFHPPVFPVLPSN